MLFSSVIFLFFFLPVALTFYFVPSRKWRNFYFLLASLVFYAWSESAHFAILPLSVVSNFLFGLWLDRAGAQERRPRPTGIFQSRKTILVLGLIFNLGLLVFFKYANFLSSNLAGLLNWFGLPQIGDRSEPSPIGISFFTFHAISYLVDIYRREVPVQKNIGSLAIYIGAFPKLLAGPIVSYGKAAHQLAARATSVPLFTEGMERFVTGLAKKVLIANPLAAVSDAAFALQPAELAPYSAWAGIVCFTLQIYFDFSGYSDMAIGLGKMFGFEFPENFNFPYISQSVREFWRRWHISLSLWFRNYLYIPLGGNRRSPARSCFNLIVVFLLCGLWHGASWNFVIWGVWYGLFLVLERTGFERIMEAAPRPLRHIYLLLVVMVGWVFFRAETPGFALTYLKAMFGLHHGAGNTARLAMYIQTELLFIVALGTLLCLPVSRIFKQWAEAKNLPFNREAIRHAAPDRREMGRGLVEEAGAGRPTPEGAMRLEEPGLSGDGAVGVYLLYWAFLGILFFISIMSLAGVTHRAFIYFKF